MEYTRKELILSFSTSGVSGTRVRSGAVISSVDILEMVSLDVQVLQGVWVLSFNDSGVVKGVTSTRVVEYDLVASVE